MSYKTYQPISSQILIEKKAWLDLGQDKKQHVHDCFLSVNPDGKGLFHAVIEHWGDAVSPFPMPRSISFFPKREQSYIYLAYRDKCLIGFSMVIYFAGDDMYYISTFVEPGHRRGGLGRLLVSNVVSELEKEKFRYFHTWPFRIMKEIY